MSINSLPIIFLATKSKADDEVLDYSSYEMVVYRARNATAIFFVKLHNGSDHCNFMENLGPFLNQTMCDVASRIGDVFCEIPKVLQSDIPYHFIYYNPETVSLRTSFISSFSILPNSCLLSSNIYRLIYETYDRFVSTSDMFSQTFVKSENDWWIIFKRIDVRILALFLPQTTQSTITDVHEYVDSIIKAHFNNIFIC